MQSVVPNIHDNGVAMQWSADPTECTHITEIKHPLKSTNNQDYESQICHYLDHAEKCQQFDLAMAVHEALIDFWLIDGGPHNKGELQNAPDDKNDSLYDPEETEAKALDAVTSTATLLLAVSLAGTQSRACNPGDYFSLAVSLHKGLHPHAPRPFQTLLDVKTLLHLNQDPSY